MSEAIKQLMIPVDGVLVQLIREDGMIRPVVSMLVHDPSMMQAVRDEAATLLRYYGIERLKE